MAKKIRIAVLVSGGGSNLQAIINACKRGLIDGEVVVVGSDRPGVFGLKRAEDAGIPTFVVDYGAIARGYKEYPETLRSQLPEGFEVQSFLQRTGYWNKQGMFAGMSFAEASASATKKVLAEHQLLHHLGSYQPNLVCLAGYMRLLSPYFIDGFNGGKDTYRIMNIHPALLPSFPGEHGYEDTFNYGCRVGGCTVHFVDYGEDTGPIIGQDFYFIRPGMTIDDVKTVGLKREHDLYPKCIQQFAMGKLAVRENETGRLVVDGFDPAEVRQL